MKARKNERKDENRKERIEATTNKGKNKRKKEMNDVCDGEEVEEKEEIGKRNH